MTEEDAPTGENETSAAWLKSLRDEVRELRATVDHVIRDKRAGGQNYWFWNGRSGPNVAGEATTNAFTNPTRRD